jgi:hypothetical protein
LPTRLTFAPKKPSQAVKVDDIGPERSFPFPPTRAGPFPVFGCREAQSEKSNSRRAAAIASANYMQVRSGRSMGEPRKQENVNSCACPGSLADGRRIRRFIQCMIALQVKDHPLRTEFIVASPKSNLLGENRG